MDEELLARAARIRVLLMDVDGVMTDGTYWEVPDGQGGLAETKAFDSQDGIALRWLREAGIAGGVITGRNSPAVEQRARTAGFPYIYQGYVEKIPILEEILDPGYQEQFPVRWIDSHEDEAWRRSRRESRQRALEAENAVHELWVEGELDRLRQLGYPVDEVAAPPRDGSRSVPDDDASAGGCP